MLTDCSTLSKGLTAWYSRRQCDNTRKSSTERHYKLLSSVLHCNADRELKAVYFVWLL